MKERLEPIEGAWHSFVIEFPSCPKVSADGQEVLQKIIFLCDYVEKNPAVTVKMLDAIKALGFKYATIFGATIGMEDVIVPAKKKELIAKANGKVEEIQKQLGNLMEE